MTDEELKEAMADILKRRKILTPSIVVEEARDEGSRLHKEFNWNVQEAAESHWRSVARKLIRRVPYLREAEYRGHFKTPCYIRNPEIPTNNQGYIPLASVSKGDRSDQARYIMRDELRRVVGSAKRAAAIAKEIHTRDMADRINEIASLANDLIEELMHPRKREDAA